METPKLCQGTPLFKTLQHLLFLLEQKQSLLPRTSLVPQTVKNLPAMRETQIQFLGQEDPPGEGHGNPLQYSCLENSMDRRAWQATVHRVAKSRTRLCD